MARRCAFFDFRRTFSAWICILSLNVKFSQSRGALFQLLLCVSLLFFMFPINFGVEWAGPSQGSNLPDDDCSGLTQANPAENFPGALAGAAAPRRPGGGAIPGHAGAGEGDLPKEPYARAQGQGDAQGNVQTGGAVGTETFPPMF